MRILKKINNYFTLSCIFLMFMLLVGCNPDNGKENNLNTNHKHEFSFTTYQYDESNHWKECSYCTEKGDFNTHSVVEIKRVEPTITTSGYVEYKCEICAYTYKENLPKLAHNFEDTWSKDENYHWHKCNDCETISSFEYHSFNEGIKYSATFEKGAYIVYTCTVCEFEKEVEISQPLEHNFSSNWSFDDNQHWHACIDTGYTNLKKDLNNHDDSNEVIIRPASNEQTGLVEYTCSICNHTYQKELLLGVTINSLPTVSANVYVGQKLSDISLIGGSASIEGTFAWNNPEEVFSSNTSYEIKFVPNNDKYATIVDTISLNPIQLTVTSIAGSNGKISKTGVINVNYGAALTLTFSADTGYKVNQVLVNGSMVSATSSYTFENITTSQTFEVIFMETTSSTNLPFSLIYSLGTENCYTFENNTLTFTTITENTLYIISGEFNGNIIVDVGDEYKFELEMQGFTLTSGNINPITVLSGDEFTLTSKKEYQNYIFDTRDAIDETDTSLYSGAIHSLVDLTIGGKGSLEIESTNNNGIHSKKDLDIKNLNLKVTCKDNALKGNDSVSINGGTITLIASVGDGIKTTNSDISSLGNQRGTISIMTSNLTIYAACDGIDASYDVLIDDETTIVNIFTDQYSQYSEEVTTTSESTYYIRYTNTYYKYSVKYYKSTDSGDFIWCNASTSYQTVSSNRPGGSTYYYYTVAKPSGYDKLIVYMYSSSQTQGQDSNYFAVSSAVTVNDSYDTIKVSYGSSMSISWTNYSTSQGGGPGGMGGGMQEGNTDKGEYSTKGIKAGNMITINSGIITIKSYDDAIHSDNTTVLENGATPLGQVTINGGNITITSNDDGLHADGNMNINGGIISILSAYEGVEGNSITITGGNVAVISKDDGFNATKTSGAAITISGGEVYIYAGGDGIDSNSTTSYGAIAFKGGYTVVFSTSGGNSAIDSDGGYSYTGGYVLAIMPNGGMTSESTHCSNFSSIGKSTTSSFSSNYYVTAKFTSNVSVTVKMKTTMSAFVVCLGSSSTTISSSSSTSSTVDENGICWIY